MSLYLCILIHLNIGFCKHKLQYTGILLPVCWSWCLQNPTYKKLHEESVLSNDLASHSDFPIVAIQHLVEENVSSGLWAHYIWIGKEQVEKHLLHISACSNFDRLCFKFLFLRDICMGKLIFIYTFMPITWWD